MNQAGTIAEAAPTAIRSTGSQDAAPAAERAAERATGDQAAAYYEAAQVERHRVDDATLAVRCFGRGPALVLIHGFPTHGHTWRFLLPALAERFTCFTVDLAGLGDSQWDETTDFRFTAQARRVNALLERLGIERCSLIAHDTGATVARLVALHDPERVASQVLINTEVPGHRPPWIPLYCRTASLPGASLCFRPLLGMSWYQRSGMGFGAFYSDRRLFDDPSRLGPYVEPLLRSGERLRGMLGYLAGIEWKVVDDLRGRHARLQGPTLLVWGEDDVTFPIAEARGMLGQFAGRARLVPIARASLMPHEEKPREVLDALLPFLAESLGGTAA